jgi:predicted metal-binding membrane protein
VSTLAVTRLVWRHPQWWSLALAGGAWVVMIRNAGHHAHGFAPWMLMTVAMMLPMVSEHVRLTAERSLWKRRHRAMAGFLVGYLGLWAIPGIALAFVPFHPDARAAAIAFAIAAVWQLTPWKRRALVWCHRTMPLAPRGWRADADCIRFGWLIGTRCFLSCWALMLACVMSGHALLATAGLLAIGLAERYVVRDQRLLAAALFVAAALSLRWTG